MTVETTLVTVILAGNDLRGKVQVGIQAAMTLLVIAMLALHDGIVIVTNTPRYFDHYHGSGFL
jgi:hypothetical protein